MILILLSWLLSLLGIGFLKLWRTLVFLLTFANGEFFAIFLFKTFDGLASVNPPGWTFLNGLDKKGFIYKK